MKRLKRKAKSPDRQILSNISSEVPPNTGAQLLPLYHSPYGVYEMEPHVLRDQSCVGFGHQLPHLTEAAAETTYSWMQENAQVKRTADQAKTHLPSQGKSEKHEQDTTGIRATVDNSWRTTDVPVSASIIRSETLQLNGTLSKCIFPIFFIILDEVFPVCIEMSNRTITHMFST